MSADPNPQIAVDSRTAATTAHRALGLLPLVCVMYLVISGGAYGLEDAVRLAGPKLAILLCIAVPITLSVPTALMAAELTALMPLEGGFYFWVKEALGPFWGFAEAYLTILYTAVDMAIYPVLFAAYLTVLIPVGPLGQAALGVAVVWISGLLNLAGVRPVGNASILLATVLIAPFIAMVALGMGHVIHFTMPAVPLFGADPWGALGAGLTVVIWNFCGWENLSVVAAEIENPRRNYVRAIAVAMPIIVAGYVLPLVVCLSGATSVAHWHEGTFATQGFRIGGPILGGALAVGGGLMAFAVFEAAMLWVSRMPFVLAHEGYLPKSLRDIWAATTTPWKSIVLCCVVFTLLIPLGFVALVVLDVFFYMAALTLEMIALVRLRKIAPRRDGMFTVGGGTLGLGLVVTLPILTWAATFGLAISAGAGKTDFLIAIALGLTVWPAYAIARRRWGGPARLTALAR